MPLFLKWGSSSSPMYRLRLDLGRWWKASHGSVGLLGLGSRVSKSTTNIFAFWQASCLWADVGLRRLMGRRVLEAFLKDFRAHNQPFVLYEGSWKLFRACLGETHTHTHQTATPSRKPQTPAFRNDPDYNTHPTLSTELQRRVSPTTD